MAYLRPNTLKDPKSIKITDFSFKSYVFHVYACIREKRQKKSNVKKKNSFVIVILRGVQV